MTIRRMDIWAGARMIDLRGLNLDYRAAPPRRVEIDGFADVSDGLSVGVIVLAHAGRVVYVARADTSMLATIATLNRTDIPFLPRMEFDQILIRRCASDRANALVVELIAEHQPRYNTIQKSNVVQRSTVADPNFRRRI